MAARPRSRGVVTSEDGTSILPWNSWSEKVSGSTAVAWVGPSPEGLNSFRGTPVSRFENTLSMQLTLRARRFRSTSVDMPPDVTQDSVERPRGDRSSGLDAETALTSLGQVFRDGHVDRRLGGNQNPVVRRIASSVTGLAKIRPLRGAAPSGGPSPLRRPSRRRRIGRQALLKGLRGLPFRSTGRRSSTFGVRCR